MTGNDLKAIRHKLGLTQVKLAEKLKYASYMSILILEGKKNKPISKESEWRIRAILELPNQETEK